MAKAIVSLITGLIIFGGRAQADVSTLQQTLSINLTAAGKITSLAANTSLLESGGAFSPFTAALPINFLVRTSPSGSSSQMSVQVTTDFSPTNGPSVAGGNLTYTCSAATLGTSCSGQAVASTASQTIISFAASACSGGGGSCSTSYPNTITISFQLANNTSYKANNYAATLTFTISAL